MYSRNARSIALIIGLATLPIAACTTLSVHRDDTQLHGVPFYVKTAVYRRTSTYATTLWDVEISVDVLPTATATEGSTRRLYARTMSDSDYHSASMESIRTSITAANARPVLKQDEFDSFVATLTGGIANLGNVAEKDDCAVQAKAAYCPLVSNRVTRDLVVDTSKMYTINGRRPLAGSAQSTFALGADLTLTTATAQQDDKTLEQVLSVLPVKEYLSKTLGLVAADASKPSGQASLMNLADSKAGTKGDVFLRVNYSATPHVVLYRASKTLAGNTLAGVLTLESARAGIGGVELEREVVDAAASGKEKAEDAPAYKISGSITVPKAPTDAAKPAQE